MRLWISKWDLGRKGWCHGAPTRPSTRDCYSSYSNAIFELVVWSKVYLMPSQICSSISPQVPLTWSVPLWA